MNTQIYQDLTKEELIAEIARLKKVMGEIYK